MKKFLGKSKKETESKIEGGFLSRKNSSVTSNNLEPSVSPAKSCSTVGTETSSEKLSMMFKQDKWKEGASSSREGSNIARESDLNINPVISNSKAALSDVTSASTKLSGSIFSYGGLSSSTRSSSFRSSLGKKNRAGYTLRGKLNSGQALQIVDVPEEIKEIRDFGEFMLEKIQTLYSDITFISLQFRSSVINLSTAVIETIQCFKSFVTSCAEFNGQRTEVWNFDTYNSEYLRKIFRIYLNFYDNMLVDDVYLKLKLMLVRSFNDFTKELSSAKKFSSTADSLVMKPRNYAIGINKGEDLPNVDVLKVILRRMASSSKSISDQNGAFVAPICRGVETNLNILCLYFGFPNPTEYHFDMAKNIGELYDDIHVMVARNQIETCSSTRSSYLDQSEPYPYPKTSHMYKFKLPFRVPRDPLSLPISLSLSTESSTCVSGTVGGYIYPKINVQKHPHLKSYTNSKFAISCGHVCLDNTGSGVDYPYVSAPSAFMISLYKQALTVQYQKVSEGQHEKNEAAVAYGAALKQIDEMFPLSVVGKSKDNKPEVRNLPKHRFGQIIWGERLLIDSKSSYSSELEKQLSDLAIIKVNKNFKCDQNYLGDDIAFNEYDPALMFDNLYVRGIINLRRDMETSIDEVDENVEEARNFNGLSVFKYGSTTKYTKGNLNGIRLVYWSDGAIQSSEFVVSSVENSTAFAAGGDSGSWILTKLDSCSSSPEAKGLGVVGMLHSHDGEQKQFGLFTPIKEILDRLEEVTNIKWGIVGVPEKDMSMINETHSISSEDLDSDGFDSESDSITGEDLNDDEFSRLDQSAFPPVFD